MRAFYLTFNCCDCFSLPIEDLTCHFLINRQQKTSFQFQDHANTSSCFPSANTDTTSFIQASSNSRTLLLVVLFLECVLFRQSSSRRLTWVTEVDNAMQRRVNFCCVYNSNHLIPIFVYIFEIPREVWSADTFQLANVFPP